MKKIYLMLTAMLALFATTAKADKFLYTENYENGTVPTAWTVNGGTGTISGDSEGKFFSFALGQDNARSAHSLWGTSVFESVLEGLTEYNVSVDFMFGAFGNQATTAQWNGEISLFTGDACEVTNGAKSGTYGSYDVLSNNCLFSLKQDNTDEATIANNQWYINGDKETFITPVAEFWYNLTLKVNLTTREVTYELNGISDDTFHKSGSKVMPEDANMLSGGLYILDARYQSVTNIDNIIVSIPGDFANDPVIALTGVNNNERTFTITFQPGETLHIIGTDGTETQIGYNDTGDIPGSYTYKTTTSGTLKCYTTIGTLQSGTIEKEVDCNPIQLPQATWTITKVAEGFGKSFQFNVDKSSLPIEPEIFLDIVFTPENGTPVESTNQNLGATIEATSKGVITVTAKSTGFVSSTTTINNDQEYEIDLSKSINFAHLTDAEITAAGYKADGNVTGNYAKYGRLYCVTEAGDTLVYNEIPQFTKLSSEFTDGTLFTGLTYIGAAKGTAPENRAGVAPTVNAHIWPGVGINLEGRAGDDMSGNWIDTGWFTIDGLTDDMFTATYSGGNYGNGGTKDSNHPVVTSLDETRTSVNLIENTLTVRKGTEPIPLYRISDVIGRIDVLVLKGTTGIEELPYNKVVSDHNAPIYNLNGVRVDGALKKGIYIKQGKKFVVQ